MYAGSGRFDKGNGSKKNGQIRERCAGNERFRLLFTVIIFALAVSVLVIGVSKRHTYKAQASAAYETTVLYKSIRVENGDTLWNIADMYMCDQFKDKESYIDEVKRLNHLSDEDMIHTGSYLLIPYEETVSDSI